MASHESTIIRKHIFSYTHILSSCWLLLSTEAFIYSNINYRHDATHRKSAKCTIGRSCLRMTATVPPRGSTSRSSSTFGLTLADSGPSVYNSNSRKRITTAHPTPDVEYDVESISHYYDRRPLEVGWRLNSIGLPLLGWYIELLFDGLTGADKKESVQRKRGAELRGHLVRSGSVALVKSGQALSLRPDLIRNKIWAEELGKLVDAVGSFSDVVAMDILRDELADMLPRLEATKLKLGKSTTTSKSKRGRLSRIEAKFENDLILGLFEFSNGNRAVASASIGQVYKARIKRGPMLEAAIGKEEAAKWGGKTVAVKIQRPDATSSASLDIYLLRRAAEWLSRWRGGGLPAIVDQFGMQLFGELDYVREAQNGEQFRELYGDWEQVLVPKSCTSLTRKKVLVTEWVDGVKGPWSGQAGIDMVRIGLKCSVDQLMHTGFFHADPHRGNLLMTPNEKLAFLDFGMMATVPEEDRYGLIGLIIGLQLKDLPLATENLLKLGFLKDTTQLDLIVPRLRKAVKNATGGTGKTKDLSFTQLQAELDNISRENVLKFSTPAFFTVIIRSLTILEGLALSVDSNFRLVRGAYPYVLAQLVSPETENGGNIPESLTNLLTRLLTVNGEGQRIEWERLRDFLRLAQKAVGSSNDDQTGDEKSSRQTMDLFYKFLTSKTGKFLKVPLVHEVAEAIDGMASVGEATLLRASGGLIRPFPGGNGPINSRRMEELRSLVDIIISALVDDGKNGGAGTPRMEVIMEFLQAALATISDEKRRDEMAPILAEISSVSQMVAVEVLEIRGSRAMRNMLRLVPGN